MSRQYFLQALLLGVAIFLSAHAGNLARAAEAPVDVPLHGESSFHFATLAEAKTLLGRTDQYINALSRFDRQCRMTTAVEPTDEELLRFIAAQAIPWEPAQIDLLSQRIAAIRQKLTPYRLSFPRQILLVQTTGRDEGNAAYCRFPAVILPQATTKKPTEEIERLLIHELFHIMSVHDAKVRKSLYRLIGFQICDEVELPLPFAHRKLTNPDAPLINCWIEVDVNGKKASAAPILYASADHFDPMKGGSLFTYLTFRLMLLERDGNKFRPLMQDDMPVMVDAKKLPTYYDKIGKNTNYIIHPDEILADNFSFMVLGRGNLATPLLIDKMKQVLTTK